MRVYVLFMLVISSTFATQTPQLKNGLPLTGPVNALSGRTGTYCDVRAQFISDFHDTEELSVKGIKRLETRVGWKMKRLEKLSTSTGACPSGDFELWIRGALHVKDNGGHDRYIYRDDLPQPDPDPKTYRVRRIEVSYGPGGKKHMEWRIVSP